MDNQQPQTPTPSAGTPIYQESQEKNAKWLWLLIALIIVGAVVFAVVRRVGPFARLGGGEEVSPTPVAAITSPSPGTVSESTEEATLAKSQPKIRVLNGSGKAGVASAFKTFLEGKGYKVTAIGNAANFNFEQTVLRFKESFRKFEEILLKDLSDDYSVKVSSDSLEATDEADIEVIVGAK